MDVLSPRRKYQEQLGLSLNVIGVQEDLPDFLPKLGSSRLPGSNQRNPLGFDVVLNKSEIGRLSNAFPPSRVINLAFISFFVFDKDPQLFHGPQAYH